MTSQIARHQVGTKDNMTRKQQILHLLEDCGDKGTTVMDAIRMHYGTELRKNVSDLIKDGYQISSVWEKNNGSRYKRYFLTGYQGKYSLPDYFSNTLNDLGKLTIINK